MFLSLGRRHHNCDLFFLAVGTSVYMAAPKMSPLAKELEIHLLSDLYHGRQSTRQQPEQPTLDMKESTSSQAWGELVLAMQFPWHGAGGYF